MYISKSQQLNFNSPFSSFLPIDVFLHLFGEIASLITNKRIKITLQHMKTYITPTLLKKSKYGVQD